MGGYWDGYEHWLIAGVRVGSFGLASLFARVGYSDLVGLAVPLSYFWEW